MAALGGVLWRLAPIWLILVLVAPGCDPGSELTLQLHNKAGHSVQVVVPAMVPSEKAPPKEIRGIDTVLEPGQAKEMQLGLGLGWYAETVRAYADDTLIFCERYEFAVRTGSSARYSVEILEGHIAPGCQDPGPPK